MRLLIHVPIALVLLFGVSPAQMLAPAAEDSPLFVSAEWLAEHRAEPGLRIVDVRPAVHDYLAGHVPGAIHLPAANLRASAGGLPARLLPAKLLASILSRAGIGDGQRVVLYADGDQVVDATLVAWALERLGHRDTAIVDGGFKAFARGAAPTQDLAAVPPAKLRATKAQPAAIALKELLPLVGQPGIVLLDVRNEAAYLGESKTWVRNGHIPGAVNLDWRLLTRSDDRHRLLPADEIRALLEKRGVTPDADVVIYCGTGREATLPYLVLTRMLGFPCVRLYEGSWTEWSAQKELPVETGRPGAPPAAPTPPPAELLGRMFDPRTVETVTAPLASIELMLPPAGRRGGVHWTLKTPAGPMVVHIGPPWFLEDKGFLVQEGETVTVKGSRVVLDGVPFLIAAEVRAGDRSLRLRDENGLPLWRSRR